MRATAPDGHTPPNRPPVQIHPGESVSVGERDTDWPAFVFITTDDGQGWVPARHLSTASGSATVLASYDTTELALEPGADVHVVRRDDESGWWWCQRSDGTEGWVPTQSLLVIQ
jgi:hypothetical protein